MQLEDTLRKIIEEECEDYFFGVADLTPAKKLLAGQEESLISEYPKAISIGFTMPPTVQSNLLKNDNSKANHTDYNELIQRLNIITTRLSNSLQQKGYKSRSIDVTDKLDDQRIFNAFSHQLIANLAGLGWIGNDGSLITPEIDSGVLWGTVLTDAPLKVIEKPLREHNDLNKLKTIYSPMDGGINENISN
jgi:epoxyqueuosine reductase QueG